MSFPLIGLTTRHGKNEYGAETVALSRAYVEAVAAAGGVPVLIPSGLSEAVRQALFARLDGILFTGGGDIAPERFGATTHPTIGEVDPERDSLEFALLGQAVQEQKPFLGICRGCQVLNVALGGTLYTHIPDQLANAGEHDFHAGHPRSYLAHAVKVEKKSRLAEILGQHELKVNSLHHQGAAVIAPALQPVAFAPDGLVEGLELPGHPFGFGVQWHPECMDGQPSAGRLFRAFVQAADQFKEGR